MRCSGPACGGPLIWVVRPRRAGVIDTDQGQTKRCDECGSDYRAAASVMMQLCPECAHWLYGYPRCLHEFIEGRCSRCGWDGSVSAYLRGLQAQQSVHRIV